MHRRGFFGFLAGLPFGVASTALAAGSHGESIDPRPVYVTQPHIGEIRDIMVPYVLVNEPRNRHWAPLETARGSMYASVCASDITAVARRKIFDGECWVDFDSAEGGHVLWRLPMMLR
jgi:hypothetical protein